MNLKKDDYLVTFTFKRELEKSILVSKKTKTINKIFFIPKSIIIDEEKYTQTKSDGCYERKRIAIRLPKWYCETVLKFYK